MLKGRDATESCRRCCRRTPPPPLLFVCTDASVGSAPLPPLPQQQEKLERISGSKLDPGPQDEEALVTSLAAPREPQITFLSQKTSKIRPPPLLQVQPGIDRCVCGGGQALYTLHGSAEARHPGSSASSGRRRIHPVVRRSSRRAPSSCVSLLHFDTAQGRRSNELVVLSV